MKKIFLLSFLFIYSINLVGQSSEVTFTTKDEITINATFHLSKVINSKSPAIILIHQGGSSKEEWTENKIWNDLIEEGYSLLAYDIRSHGKSEKDKGDIYDLFNNPNRAPLDLIAAMDFLKNKSSIDSNRIGILGASIGANLACVASSSDKYDVKSIVSISAKTAAVKNLSGENEELNFKNAFFIASKKEQDGKRENWANELFSRTSEHKKVKIAEGEKHGSYILKENQSISNEVVNWFIKTL